jgi:hypothetical protein
MVLKRTGAFVTFVWKMVQGGGNQPRRMARRKRLAVRCERISLIWRNYATKSSIWMPFILWRGGKWPTPAARAGSDRRARSLLDAG